MDVRRCGGAAFIATAPSAGAHRSFLICADRVFIVRGGGDDGGLEGIGRRWGTFLRSLPSGVAPQAGRSRGHQGPLCAGYHQVVSDGTAASRSQERQRVEGRLGGRGGEGRGGEGAHEEQIGMFPEETGSAKERRKKGKKEAVVVSSGLVSQVRRRRNVLRCDDSIELEPSMK